MKLKIFLILALITPDVVAAELKPFKATYKITRDGKKTGEQTTVLTQINDNHWRLVDKIIGTNGLASMIGFSRTETTDFKFSGDNLMAINHQMRQKAAFSKKQYSFKWRESTQQYQVKHKGDIHQYAPSDDAVISAQLMPLSLALAACNQRSKLDLLVLKNKKPKNYQFTIKQSHPMSAQRVYESSKQKESITWLDYEKQCLPIKQSHQDNDEPRIETTLIKFNWL